MNKTRRLLIRTIGSGALALPLINFSNVGVVLAADIPKLSPDDPTAKSLEYTHASTDADKRCAGCQFYTGATGDEWGLCVIFPGKQVNARGLCKSWYAKA